MAEQPTGSCLCGSIKFRIEGDLGVLGHCHCKMCQKAHGAAYATYVNVRRDDLVFTEGASHLAEYTSSPGIKRTFCNQCGATLQFIRDEAERIGVAAGCFDTPLPVDVRYEIWTSTAAPWGQRHAIAESHLTHPTRPGIESV